MYGAATRPLLAVYTTRHTLSQTALSATQTAVLSLSFLFSWSVRLAPAAAAAVASEAAGLAECLH